MKKFRRIVDLLQIATMLTLGACRGVGLPPCQPNVPLSDVEVVLLPGLHVTSALFGRVLPLDAESWTPENRAALTVWGSAVCPQSPMVFPIPLDGSVPRIALAPGVYCFQLSADGFSPVVGQIRIAPHARAVALEVIIHLSA